MFQFLAFSSLRFNFFLIYKILIVLIFELIFMTFGTVQSFLFNRLELYILFIVECVEVRWTIIVLHKMFFQFLFLLISLILINYSKIFNWNFLRDSWKYFFIWLIDWNKRKLKNGLSSWISLLGLHSGRDIIKIRLFGLAVCCLILFLIFHIYQIWLS